jgi:DNA-binding transcriptional ArsR family regulator
MRDLHVIMHFMKVSPPPLLPLLRSGAHGELLAWLYLHPDEEYSTQDLAYRVGLSQSTVSREADRWVESGLALERRIGRNRMLRAATGTILARPLTDLLALTFGPLPVLGSLLAGVRGVEEAYIYGSWAARYAGDPGPLPRDIDLLVVGDADPDDVYDAAREAETRLAREVNVTLVTPERWRDAVDDPFLAEIRRRPMVSLQQEEGTAS